MKPEPLAVSLKSVRRLAVAKQRLAGKLPSRPGAETILSVVRDLAYVQWDPVSIVAPSHLISLWARLGAFRPQELERLLWKERKLFLHWAPIASILLTEDYPLYLSLMRRYPDSLSGSWGAQRTEARRFLAEHRELRAKVLSELKGGPLTIGEFEDHPRTPRDDGEWTPRSNVALMLSHLLMAGEVMVVGHRGAQNLWGLSKDFLPDWVDRRALPEKEFDRVAARRAIRALGAATPTEINYHFVRGRYQDLRGALARLEADSEIRRVKVDGFGDRDERYILCDDIPRLESLEGPDWEPRMSLLPPFDNLIHSTARTRQLFGFDYVREQFLPKEKRRFGTYVLPILWGDRLIGRIDPRLDKARSELVINGVHAEPHAPQDPEIAEEIASTIARFAKFLGARQVTYPSQVPEAWKGSLR